MAQPQESIRPSDLQRLTLQQQLAERAGFSLAPPYFDLGTPCLKIGQDNFAKRRQEFDAMPKAAEVFAPFLRRIAQEVRKDVTVNVNGLRMRLDGRIVRADGDPDKTLYFDGAKSLRSLLERTDCDEPGAASTYLATIPADRRAAEVNHLLADSKPDATAVLRTRLALAPPDVIDAEIVSEPAALTPYGREVYAVVSERYGTGVEVDVIARTILEAIERGLFPGDARGEILYDGHAATIRAIWHSNVNPADVCAGEVFKAGAGITSRDDGFGGLDVDGIIWRNLCLNFLCIDEATQNFGSRRHLGNTSELAAWLYSALRQASESVGAFARLWDQGRAQALDTITRDVPADKSERDVTAGVLRGLLKTGRLALPGYRGEAAVSQFMTAWTREPEFSRVGVVNAITRAAHETPLKGAFASGEVEAAGGAVLSQKRPFQYVEVGEVF